MRNTPIWWSVRGNSVNTLKCLRGASERLELKPWAGRGDNGKG